MIAVPDTTLQALAAAFEIDAATLTHFGGGREDSDGVVYAYPWHSDRHLIKIMAFPEVEQRRSLFSFEERLRFMRFLGENRAPVVFPISSPRGRLYETHTGDGHLWVAYCMEIAVGKSLPFHTWDETLFQNWGRAVGRMHHLAGQYPSWEASIYPENGQPQLTWREEWEWFYQACPAEAIKQKWLELRERMNALPHSRDDFGFVHNDPHLANLVAEGDQVTMLDFDVANHHWFASDIAIASQSILFSHSGGMERPLHQPEKLHAFLRCFLAGYAREHHLAPFWLEQLDLFIAYRRILLFTVMQGWLQTQPETLASWRDMILSQPPLLPGGVI